jgi:uncharacterized membrane protein YkoI
MSRTQWVVLGVAVVMGIAMVGSAIAAGEATSKPSAAPAASKPTLPEAVAKAFKAEFPKGEIAKADEEKENGITVYDIEFKEGGLARETDIAADGTILTVAVVVDPNQVPQAAMKAIKAAAEGGAVKQVEKTEIRCEAKDGKITRLDKPKTEYEAAMTKGDLSAEVVVDDKGAVVEAPKWAKPGEKTEDKPQTK